MPRQKKKDARKTPSESPKSDALPQPPLRNLFHDIRAPLSNILATTDCLNGLIRQLSSQSDGDGTRPLNQKISGFLKNIRKEVWKIDTMLLNFSESTCRATYHPRPANLRKLLAALIESYQNTYSKGERSYELYYSLHDDYFVFDPVLITRAVENLLSNSTKFTKKGMIMIEVSSEDDFVCIIVKDSGIGIRKNDLPRIFEPGFQGANHKQLTGYGIGLYNVCSIVEKHGGRIEVSSRVRKGTVIKLKLPIRKCRSVDS
jgi:signal transduction histidine kinase